MFESLPPWLNIILTIIAIPAGLAMVAWVLAAFYYAASNIIVPIIEESTGSKFGKPFKIALSIIMFIIIVALYLLFSSNNKRPIDI